MGSFAVVPGVAGMQVNTTAICSSSDVSDSSDLLRVFDCVCTPA